MPKRILYDEDEQEEDDDEEFPDDDDDFLDEEPKKEEKKGRPKLNIKKSKKIEKPKPQPKVKKEEPEESEEEAARYVAFSSPPRAGVMDSETGEVLAEGEFGIYQMLANMKTQLDRVENSIGAILEG